MTSTRSASSTASSTECVTNMTVTPVRCPDLQQLVLQLLARHARRARRTARPSGGSRRRWPARARSPRAASCRRTAGADRRRRTVRRPTSSMNSLGGVVALLCGGSPRDAGRSRCSAHRQPGKQRVVLEHHAAVAAGTGDRLALHRRTSPRGRLLEAGDDAQQRRLAAARGADQADELAFASMRQIDASRSASISPAPTRERLGHAAQSTMGSGAIRHGAAGSSAAGGCRACTMSRSDMKPPTPITIMPAITISVRDSVRPSMMTGAEPGRHAGHLADHDQHPGKAVADAQAREDRRQRGRQHDLAEHRRAGAAEHAGGLEQPRHRPSARRRWC